MATTQNVETCKKGYAAIAAGDLETVLSLYDDDIELVMPGNSTISGTYRGKEELTEFYAKVAEHPYTLTPSRFLADGDVVVVLSQVTAGGESAPGADVYTFRDGKVVKAQNFGDTAMAERVYGTK